MKLKTDLDFTHWVTILPHRTSQTYSHAYSYLCTEERFSDTAARRAGMKADSTRAGDHVTEIILRHVDNYWGEPERA